jgi:hypothetical protein
LGIGPTGGIRIAVPLVPATTSWLMTDPAHRLHVVLHFAAGGALLASSWAVGHFPTLVVHWLPWQKPLLSAGLLLLAGAGLYQRQAVSRITCRLCVMVLTVVGMLTAAEVAFRAAGYDFRHQARFIERTPPFYRKPTVPVGEVYFRREGPLAWTGQVIRSQLRALGYPDYAYHDEPAITVRYDSDGFRNEDYLAAWHFAVAGDSFVELGHLSFADLFTTRLARRLDRPVRNLGVSNTGSLSHLCYLEHFGLSPSLRDVVIVFYEGNDPQDLTAEYDALQRYQATGKRSLRQVKKQTSLLRALGERRKATEESLQLPVLPTNAWVVTAQGDIPITLSHRLKSGVGLPPATAQALDEFLARFATFGRTHRVRVWLVYLPTKVRVLEGRLRWHTPEDEQQARPLAAELPGLIEAACVAAGVRFHDLTPALRAETSSAGSLGFNGLYDTHLDVAGAAIVAEDLGKMLMAPEGDPPAP